jgi:nucleotide-binding universal stress UspA family protein
MKYKTIICPVDGGETTDAVAEHAAYISKTTDAKLILVNVIEKWYRSQGLVTDSAEWQKIHDEWLGEGRELLEKTAKALTAKGVKHVETSLREGDAAYEIVALALERNADLIVMATKRYSPLGKLFVGSLTDKVTRKAPCPILWVFSE